MKTTAVLLLARRENQIVSASYLMTEGLQPAYEHNLPGHVVHVSGNVDTSPELQVEQRTVTQYQAQETIPESLVHSEWALKEITWPPSSESNSPRTVKIITQNKNGPCSFIAVCNILILRGNIEILPRTRRSASYEYLSSLVGDYLLSTADGSDIAASLSILPKTQEGMDLNPLFTGISSFRPSGDGGELQLFKMAKIKLVHGWLVDPESAEYPSLAKTEDYDTSMNTLVEADDMTQGQFAVADDALIYPTETANNWAPEQREKIEDALMIRRWLDSNSSQLTYYGLFSLSSTLQAGELVALFRSSHLSVLYKHQTSDSSTLYTLVSEYSFRNEPSVVWESLTDVDGQTADFVDSNFLRSSPAGGDFVGRTAESTLRDLEGRCSDEVTRGDQALAQQLQLEEDAHARAFYEQQQAQQRAQQPAYHGAGAQTMASPDNNLRLAPHASDENSPEPPEKKKKDCVIM